MIMYIIDRLYLLLFIYISVKVFFNDGQKYSHVKSYKAFKNKIITKSVKLEASKAAPQKTEEKLTARHIP